MGASGRCLRAGALRSAAKWLVPASIGAVPAWVWLAAASIAVLSAGCQEPKSSSILMAGEGFVLELDLDRGTVDVMAGGVSVLERAFAEAEVIREGDSEGVIYRTCDPCERSVQILPVVDALGTGQRMEIWCAGVQGAPDWVWELAVYDGRPFFISTLKAVNTTGGPVVMVRQVPLKIEAESGGALRLGTHPASHRILEAGSAFVWDFFVDLVPGNVEEQVQNVIVRDYHGGQKGHSISNWNHAIRDLESGLSFVAGTLDFEYASPMFNTSFDPAVAVVDGSRTPFTYWSAEFPYLPAGKPLEPGASLRAGPVFVLPGTFDPFAGLEAYALAVKEHNAIRLWPERGPENRVPTGWNSWTGSGGSGGYGSGIDQQLMLDNLDAMATEFGDFGGEWFQIDDGYEYAYGDWDWRPDRFPDGSAWMADQIETRGLVPGVWIAAFQVDENSQTYQAHQADGWFPDQLPMVSGGVPVVDLSHPDVLAWLTDRFRRIRADGYRWVKTDFGYYALGAEAYHDPTVTREEAFRRGLAAIKAGLDAGAVEAGGQPGDTFWLTVAMMGPHVGFVDSMRANLDTMPAWDKESGGQTRMTAQGFKPTVRTIARRYYLQNRVWIFNHDMLFFRSHPDPDVPPITFDEARCLLTAVGLSGSVAKLGEKVVEMEPDWINDYRRMLPVYGHAARPLDLFEREYPETWHLHVVPAEGLNTAGQGPAYDVVALFNWGTNEDLTQSPYGLMADEPRTLTVDLEAIGLDPEVEYIAREFWSGQVLYSVRRFLTRTVQPHTVQLFALRPRHGRPQYIGGNRHLLQGAVEVRSIQWDEGGGTLSVTYDAAPSTARAPFQHRLDFFVPDGFILDSAAVPEARPETVGTGARGHVVSVWFEVDVRQTVAVQLAFSRP